MSADTETLTEVLAEHEFRSASMSRNGVVTHHAGCMCDPEIKFDWYDRDDEYRAHLFAAIYEAGQAAARIVQARAGEGALREACERLVAEWEREGDDLIRNCSSGRDVNEGEQMKSCARDLRAALDPEATT